MNRFLSSSIKSDLKLESYKASTIVLLRFTRFLETRSLEATITLLGLKNDGEELKNLKFTECRVGGDLVEKHHFIKNSLPISSSHDSAKSLESVERNSQITLLVPSNTRHRSHRRGRAWTICTWSMNAHFCTFCHKHFALFFAKKNFLFSRVRMSN